MLSRLRGKLPLTFWTVPIMIKAVAMVMFSVVGLILALMGFQCWFVGVPAVYPPAWAQQPLRGLLGMIFFLSAYACFRGGYGIVRDTDKPRDRTQQ